MMRFLRVMLGCSRREAAHDEDFARCASDRAILRAEMQGQVREAVEAARKMEAAGRLLSGVKRDTTQC